MSINSFPTWKTIELKPRDVSQLRSPARSTQFGLLNEAGVSAILDGDAFCPSKTTAVGQINLVKVHMRDLGFNKAATTYEIQAEGVRRGFQLCPPLVGPILRAEYDDQPEGEWLDIEMEPIGDRSGMPWIFCLVRNFQGRWLGAQNALAKTDFTSSFQMIFAR